jgi:hypothetical protein
MVIGFGFDPSVGGAAPFDIVPGRDEVTDTPLLPDPATFDLFTTTDTEVGRMRSELIRARVAAAVDDLVASTELTKRNAERAEAELARGAAADELVASELALGTAAIGGYIGGTDMQNRDLLAPSLETEAGSTRANDTTDQLIANRAIARAGLAKAEEAVRAASAAADAAARHKSETEAGLAAVADELMAFDERASLQAALAKKADLAAAKRSDEVELRSVAGSIIVNAEIEGEVDRLIADARGAGIDLGGGGYRTADEQIGLRIAHCGGPVPPGLEVPGPDSTPEEHAAYDAAVAAWMQYVIYEMPAGACSPPTATAGNSQHEVGLAIDFTENGQILTADSPAFLWLSEHAAEYGLLNLPSEPWHWSTTGS